EITLSCQYRLPAGDLSKAASEVQAFVDAGATHIVLVIPPPFPDGIVTRVADEVIANSRAWPSRRSTLPAACFDGATVTTTLPRARPVSRERIASGSSESAAVRSMIGVTWPVSMRSVGSSK